MRRSIKRMLWIATLLTGAFFAAVVTSPFWLRPLIQHQASAILGRPISIGSLRESLSSVAPLVVDFDNRDVVVGNPPGFPAAAEPFARLARMRVSLDVLSSLRRGELMTILVDLQQPVITAASTADGEKNYIFPSRHAQADELRITEGHMHVTLAGLHADLQGDFATQAISGPDGKPQIAVMAKGTYADLPATLLIICDAALRSGNDARPSAFTMQITDGQTKIAAQGTLLDPISPSRANLTMTMSGPDMALLKPLIGASLPATPAYKLDVRLDYANELYHITGNAGRVGQSDLEGEITVRNTGGQSRDVTVDLASHDATLADIAAVIANEPRAANTPAKTGMRLFSSAPLQLPQIAGGVLHLTYRAQAIRGVSTFLHDLDLHAELAEGSLALQPFEVGIGRGKLTGALTLVSQADGEIRADADVRLESIGLAHLVGPTKYQEAGSLSGTMKLAGAGASVAALLGTADGGASLWMQQGELSALLVNLAGLRLGSAVVTWLSGQRATRVDCFVADLGLRHGIVTPRALILETTDLLMQGSGSASLAQERLDLRLWTQSKHLTVGVLPGPLLISGPLAAPSSEPDPSAAVSHGLARILSILPGVQWGVGDAPRCEVVLDRFRNGRSGR